LRLSDRVRVNINDVRHLGPTVLLRHLGRLRPDSVATIRIPGLGPVHIRAGDSDMAAIRQVFIDRQYDLAWPSHLQDRMQARYDAMLAAGEKPIIVDAGANIGAAALWFESQFPQANIVAIEPDPSNASILRRNVAGRPNCVVLEAAVGSVAGRVSLVDEGMSWAIRTERSEHGVEVVTIEDAFRASGGTTPFIVKIDIEGFESDLFSANTDWVKRCDVVIIEPHDWLLPGQRSSGSFQKVMGELSFEIFLRGENLLYARPADV
jgi:FkbM family methyltransferase